MQVTFGDAVHMQRARICTHTIVSSENPTWAAGARIPEFRAGKSFVCSPLRTSPAAAIKPWGRWGFGRSAVGLRSAGVMDVLYLEWMRPSVGHFYGEGEAQEPEPKTIEKGVICPLATFREPIPCTFLWSFYLCMPSSGPQTSVEVYGCSHPLKVKYIDVRKAKTLCHYDILYIEQMAS